MDLEKHIRKVKKYCGNNVTAAFGADLFAQGITAIPNLLLRFYKMIGVTDTEMMVLIQLFRLRTEEKNFLPSIETLAESLSRSSEDIERDLNSLLEKEVITVTEFYDVERNAVVSGYDFEPLFEKISETWACTKVMEIEKTRLVLNSEQEEDEKQKVMVLFKSFEKEFGRPLSPMETDQIRRWCERHSQAVILEALRRAVILGKHNFKYIDSILLEWFKNNLKSPEDIAEYERNFKNRRASASRGSVKNKKKELIKTLYFS